MGDTGLPVKEQLTAMYEEGWVEAGYSSADEMAEAYGEGIEILGRVAEEELWIPTNGKVLEVEKTYRLDLGDFHLVGRIDRLDELADGSLEIIDYKSGRHSISQEDAESDIALSCYQALVRAAYPDRTVRASLIYLRDPSNRTTVSMSTEAHDEFVFALKELGHHMLNHEWYEIEPVAKPLCSGCDFLSLCKRHPEFDLDQIS
jgi:CRISPR/Cas system-associated exonuclease Cas4 (RecB family)